MSLRDRLRCRQQELELLAEQLRRVFEVFQRHRAGGTERAHALDQYVEAAAIEAEHEALHAPPIVAVALEVREHARAFDVPIDQRDVPALGHRADATAEHLTDARWLRPRKAFRDDRRGRKRPMARRGIARQRVLARVVQIGTSGIEVARARFAGGSRSGIAGWRIGECLGVDFRRSIDRRVLRLGRLHVVSRTGLCDHRRDLGTCCVVRDRRLRIAARFVAYDLGLRGISRGSNSSAYAIALPNKSTAIEPSATAFTRPATSSPTAKPCFRLACAPRKKRRNGAADASLRRARESCCSEPAAASCSPASPSPLRRLRRRRLRLPGAPPSSPSVAPPSPSAPAASASVSPSPCSLSAAGSPTAVV